MNDYVYEMGTSQSKRGVWAFIIVDVKLSAWLGIIRSKAQRNLKHDLLDVNKEDLGGNDPVMCCREALPSEYISSQDSHASTPNHLLTT